MHPENLKVIFWTMRDRGHAVGDHLPVSTPRRRHCSIWQPQGTTCKPGSRQLVTVLNAAEILHPEHVEFVGYHPSYGQIIVFIAYRYLTMICTMHDLVACLENRHLSYNPQL